MQYLDLNAVLEHTVYSLLSAVTAIGVSLSLGWLFAKLSMRLRRSSRRLFEASIILPIRALVFGLAGVVYLSFLGHMLFVLHFGLSPSWIFVSSTVALSCFGTWAFASALLHKWLPEAKGSGVLGFMRILFVVAPWLSLRPGRLVASGGLSKAEMRGMTHLDLGAIGYAVLAIALISLTMDVVFGMLHYGTVRVSGKNNDTISEPASRADG